MATNGGIIGKSNLTSFGKCTVTTKTSSGDITTQPGTRVIQSLVIAGGGSGGNDAGGGGGAGGMLRTSSTNVCGGTTYAAVIGAGTANPGSPQSPGVKGTDSTLTLGSTVLTAEGGGFGTFPDPAGGPGGSGGGGRNGGAGGTGTGCQGNDGGTGQRAGGGGAGSAGSGSPNNNG